MLEHSGDMFKRRAAELGLERGDALAMIQNHLDVLYPGQTQAKKLHEGMLYIHALNAPVASELRMRQTEFMKVFQTFASEPLTKIVIQIRG